LTDVIHYMQSQQGRNNASVDNSRKLIVFQDKIDSFLRSRRGTMIQICLSRVNIFSKPGDEIARYIHNNIVYRRV